MYLIFISEELLFAFNRFTFMSYLLSLSGGLDGKKSRFWSLMCSWHCVLLSWIASIFCFEPWLFHSYDFEIVHDILFLLADGAIMYDAYSTPMMWFWVRCGVLLGSVGVACSPMLPVSCGGIGYEPVSSICHSSSWWGCEYSTFCWQNYYAVDFCSKLLYLSYVTD